MNKLFLIPCILLGLCLVIIGCKAKKAQLKEHECETSLEKLAQAKLGDSYSIGWNENNDYALVWKELKSRQNDAFPSVQFFVYEKETDEIIYESIESRAKVKWENEYILMVSSYPGIVQSGSNDGVLVYRYNVQSKKKYTGGIFN